MKPILVIRPEAGAAATVTAGAAAGLAIIAVPLSSIVPRLWTVPDPASFDALLLGSANALRHGGDGLEQYRGKPAHVVGEATARAARAAGLVVASCGSGGLQQVLDALPPEPLRLLRLAGEDHVPLTVPPHVRLVTRFVYASKPLPLPDEAAGLAAQGALVLLHSATAARHFAEECTRLGLPRGAIALAALGPRIAAAAGAGWQSVASAERPDGSALLALAREMCQ